MQPFEMNRIFSTTYCLTSTWT